MDASNEHFTWPKILCQRFSGKYSGDIIPDL